MTRTPRGVENVSGSAPRTVAELASTSVGWEIQYGQYGRWITAERVIVRDGRRWRLGLTPVGAELIALVLWSDDRVVAHARGVEAQMCALAHRRLLDLLS